MVSMKSATQAEIDLSAAARILGRLGGKASKGKTSPRKRRASRRNAALARAARAAKHAQSPQTIENKATIPA
jgi:hypothetical protein